MRQGGITHTFVVCVCSYLVNVSTFSMITIFLFSESIIYFLFKIVFGVVFRNYEKERFRCLLACIYMEFWNQNDNYTFVGRVALKLEWRFD